MYRFRIYGKRSRDHYRIAIEDVGFDPLQDDPGTSQFEGTLFVNRAEHFP